MDPSSNLKGHWNFNEGTGSVLTDLSSSGNNGTIYSAVFNTDDDLDHQNNSSQLSFSWDGADENSGIAGYEYALGTTSGGTETISWTSVSASNSVSLSSLTLSEQSTYYVSVRATDAAGNISSVLTGDGIYIDLTNPIAGTIIDGTTADISYTQSNNTLTFTWSDFSDGQSGVEFYKASIEDDDGNSVVAARNIGNVSTLFFTSNEAVRTLLC